MKNIEYVEAYRDHLLEEEKSKGTIEGYVSDVKDFMAFIKKDIKKIKKTDMNEFKEYLRQRKLKALTINRKLVGVKQFIDFANDRFELAISARVKQEKIQKQYSLKDEELLTEDDYKRLIASTEKSRDIRAKALFESMYYSGMRISEALQLRVDHVQKGLKVIEDIKGKGSKYRDIYMSDKLIKSLREYIEVRQQPFSSTTKALFVGERGPLTRQTAHSLIKKYAKAAGIELSKAHVHNLRHLFGLRLAAQGLPIQDIAKYLGHTSIEVTKIYLEKPQSHYVNLIDQL
ncbi:tyrosine-type recombinase/integrase [Bacillus sp. BRMEA1]|uniref:tyrosine-type recombinase/integrase n=1 Tax=Neobacillus endophyticus TaxID=2738405 RepID=UPI0015632CA2|nr:tyrosine-type recombinase/integrase [Neobacillus endophyticus]NRD81132.1 tyrosine-type recombinase/integrase [Neobacillus endophyticus]